MKLNFSDFDSFLIWLFVTIDNMNKQTELPLYTERLSNNRFPYFTDSELFTCALFSEIIGCQSKKSGYNYIKRNYYHWFPNLPTYEVYSRKLNKFQQAITYIYKVIMHKYLISNIKSAVIDTMPISIRQKHHYSNSKTGQPLVNKGYCASKKLYYTGVKLQVIAKLINKKLPLPFDYEVAPASTHDLVIAKESLPEYTNITVYADKAYNDESFQLDLLENNNLKLITPVKKTKGQNELTLFQKSYNTIHSSIRQPIENLFSWINRKTNIQDASKIRSLAGLLYHINIKMAAALIMMIIKL